MKTPYTHKDVSDLGWFVNRGYFPEEFYTNLVEEEDGSYTIEEPYSWSLILAQYEDEECTKLDHSFLTCMGGELLEKTLSLLDQIV